MSAFLDPAELSRALSHALRHDPAAYGLQLDTEGWVALDDVIAALRRARPAWNTLDRAGVSTMLATASKRRHEVEGGRIRAVYGHSTPVKITRAAAPAPRLLYHGTAPALIPTILRDGLKPMGRQQVHLSADRDTARQVGLRKARQPVLLVVDTAQAAAAGILFYPAGDKVWLADEIPGSLLHLEAWKQE